MFYANITEYVRDVARAYLVDVFPEAQPILGDPFDFFNVLDW